MDHKYFTEAQSGSFHSLKYIHTGEKKGTNLNKYTVVGLVDEKEFVYYDDTFKKLVPKTEWIKKNEDKNYWLSETQTMQDHESWFRNNIATQVKFFSQSDGFKWQWKYSCEMDEDRSRRGHIQYEYNGDFITLDLNKGIWTVANSDDLTDAEQNLIEHQKDYVENKCIDYLNQYINYGGGERNYSAQNFPTPSTANHLQPHTSNTSQPALGESTKYSAGFGSVAVIVGLFLIVCVRFFIWRKKKNNAPDVEAPSEVQTPSG